MARVMTAAGARGGDLLHVAFGYGLFTGGLGFHDGAERIGMTVVPVSSGNTARQHLLLRDFRPAAICGTPSFVLHIAESLAAEGGDPRALGLRYGMFGAEPWTEGVRAALEKTLGCRAYDVYGLSEIIGPGVAGECEAQAGLHVQDDHFLPEIIDPASGQTLPPGREGELVLTTLTKRAMPLVRYRTGDVTTLLAEPCPCGRTSVRMARVKGRSDDMLVIRGVNLYPSEVECTLLEVAELVPHYQLVVDRSSTLATLEVQVEPAPALAGGYGYVPWITKAPTVEEKHVVAQIVKDELRHATVMYGLLGDLGFDVETHVRKHDEIFTMRVEADADIGTARITSDKRVNIFYYPIDTWTDFIFFNFCMDRGAGHQLEDVRGCSYGPWVRAIEGIFKEEKFHIRHGEYWVKKLAEDPKIHAEAQATFNKWYIRTMNIFGRPGSPKNQLYRRYKLKLRDNDEVRQAFATEVPGLREKVGLLVPAWKPVWEQLPEEAQIPG